MESTPQPYGRSKRWLWGLGALALVTLASFHLPHGILSKVFVKETNNDDSAVYSWPAQCTAEFYKVVNGLEVPTSPAVSYYVNGSDFCMEILPEPDDLCRVLYNHERTRGWLVYVDRRTYQEISISSAEREKLRSDAKVYKSCSRSELKFIGTESISGELCEKFESKSGSDDGPTMFWVSQRLEQIVKTQEVVNGIAVGVKIARFGSPDPSVFKIPAGFQLVN